MNFDIRARPSCKLNQTIRSKHTKEFDPKKKHTKEKYFFLFFLAHHLYTKLLTHAYTVRDNKLKEAISNINSKAFMLNQHSKTKLDLYNYRLKRTMEDL